MNSREDGLKSLIKDTLEANGELNKVRAALRLQILSVFRRDKKLPMTKFAESKWHHLNLVNELIMEYFDWIGFSYSSEIFAAEIGQKTEVNRMQLEEKLEKLGAFKVTANNSVPLLLNLLEKVFREKDTQ